MYPRKLIGIGLVFILLIAGVWLLGRPATLAPETAARSQIVRQAFGPAGQAGLSAIQGELDTAADVIVHPPVEPVTVDLAALPPGPYDFDGQYQRWLSGEIDMDEKESIRPRAEIAAMQAEALKLEPNPNVQLIESAPDPSAPSIATSFDSIDFTQSGGSVPPDPELAVGPNHIIAVVNVAFQIYNKSGNSLVGPLPFATLFSGLTGCNVNGELFDPNVLYDEQVDRFFLAIDQLKESTKQSNYCVAVSKTNNPTGQWHLYRFPMNLSNANRWMDYPHAGIGRDAIYMGGNMFSLSGNFVEARVWALPKTQMYAGAAATAVERSLGAIHDTPQPINLHGYNQGTWPTSGPHYILVETNFNGRDHTLFAWNAPFGANSLTTVGSNINLNTATSVTAGMPINVPQSGGGTIQANDFRPLDFEYRNGYGWTTMTISCNPGGGTVNCVRWAQIHLATGTVTQAGVFASTGEHRFFPDLAVNHDNAMVIGYTKSSSNMFPDIWFTGRQASTPAGQLQAETQLKVGEISYTAFDGAPRRWGDYTGLTIDPDGQTFWYLGQYSKNTGTSNGRWGTYIGSFTFGAAGPTTYTTYLPAIHKPAVATPPPPPPTTLVNGDFESGPTGWTEYSLQGFPLILQASEFPGGVTPHSGNWAVWLGGVLNEISYIEQQVTVSAANPYLAYWHWIASQDLCGYDFAGVVINGSTVVHQYNLCSSANTGGWVIKVVNLSAYAGQSVALQIRAETDNTLNSNLFVDDVSFQSTAAMTSESAPLFLDLPGALKLKLEVNRLPDVTWNKGSDTSRLFPPQQR